MLALTASTDYQGVTNNIKFPGFGWEFNLRETAIENLFGIDGFNIQWYGLILTFGILCAFLLFYRNAVKKEGIDADSVYNITLFTVPIAIIGARLVYVVTEWDMYKGKGFMNMINIRNGGIAIYGAIIFGLITVLVYGRVKRTSPLTILDALAPAVMLGQTIGRWGNFVNGEAYGWSEGVESFPWRMQLERAVINGEVEYNACVHPTFLYESLWNFIGLALIMLVLYRKKKFDGQIFFAYMGWYGLGRGFIEMLRTDSLYINGTSIKFSVFVGFVCFIAAIIGTIVCARRANEEALEQAEYNSAFSAIKAIVLAEEDALNESIYGEYEETDVEINEDGDDDEYDNQDYDDDSDAETLAEQDSLDA